MEEDEVYDSYEDNYQDDINHTLIERVKQG